MISSKLSKHWTFQKQWNEHQVKIIPNASWPLSASCSSKHQDFNCNRRCTRRIQVIGLFPIMLLCFLTQTFNYSSTFSGTLRDATSGIWTYLSTNFMFLLLFTDTVLKKLCFKTWMDEKNNFTTTWDKADPKNPQMVNGRYLYTGYSKHSALIYPSTQHSNPYPETLQYVTN